MKLIPDLFFPSCFTLLTAPVASGKTRMVVEFYREHDFKIIYLSPLRALANEVHFNLQKNQEKNVFLAGGEVPLQDCLEGFLKARKSFLVTTAELLSEEFIEELFNLEEKVLFVIDEFHLFYYWGETFRPVLHEKFLAILNFYFPILAITATMDESVMSLMKKDLAFYQDFWIHLDYGNHELHRKPQNMVSFHGLKPQYIQKAFWRELRVKKDEDIFLYFCAYRSQVDELVARCNRLGFRAIGCVGGEVDQFLSNVKESEGKIDCIFSTTTLSHGVNLPEIKKVFIDYEIKNYDFWLQMIGRGGRQGSEYQVYTYDSFDIDKKSRLIGKVKILLADFIGLEM
ncbi:MAG: DEAD/DEAH box helicase [Rhizobacter sp.]|nr:DEAD/DEAH box helicase [Bacteriovorax sp.]